MTPSDLVFQVYPTSEITQIQSNRVNTLLTNGLFLFGVLGLFLIAKEIWPKKPSQGIVIQTNFTEATQYPEPKQPLPSPPQQNLSKKLNDKQVQKKH